MNTDRNKQFGKRRPEPVPEVAIRKRSGHVMLLLMGTMAVGSGAYALMPEEQCDPNRPAISAPLTGQVSECHQRSSSSSSGRWYSGGSGSSSRSNFASADSGGSSSSSSTSSSSHVTRSGFGSFASHFSGGG